MTNSSEKLPEVGIMEIGLGIWDTTVFLEQGYIFVLCREYRTGNFLDVAFLERQMDKTK